MNNTTKLLLTLLAVGHSLTTFSMHLHGHKHKKHEKMQIPAAVLPVNETVVNPPVQVDQQKIHLENKTVTPFVNQTEENIKIVKQTPGEVVTTKPENITVDTYQYQVVNSTQEAPKQEINYGPTTQTIIKEDGSTTTSIKEDGSTTPSAAVIKPGVVAKAKKAATKVAGYTKAKTALFGSALGGFMCGDFFWSRVLNSPFWYKAVISVDPTSRLAFLNDFTRLKAVEGLTFGAVVYGLYKLAKNVYEQRQEEDVFANN